MSALHSLLKYDQEVKKNCRSKLIEHAVRCLTTERDTSACVQRDHVQQVWSQLVENGEAEERELSLKIEEQIKQWEVFQESQIQTRKPSDLRVCYLAGDNPINDLQVLVDNGILCQNVWAVEKDDATLKVALKSIERSNLRNLKLIKADILNFLKDFKGQFDIIYFDACGTLPSAKQNTLKFIGYVFLHDKLTSPGALITNFSFPPKQIAQAEDAQTQDEDERKRIRGLSAEYLKYRLVNTLLDDNTPDDHDADRLSEWTDEDIYSDYITYQVIDSAYLFIPAQRMLSLSKSGKSRPLWDQMFVSKDSFLVKEYDRMENMLKNTVSESYLRKIGNTMDSQTSINCLCKAWVSEIFPDWKSSAGLKDKKLSSLLLTHLLCSSEDFILKFSNKALQDKCLGPLAKALKDGRFPRFCDEVNDSITIRLVVGLLYGQMAYPSFPVVDKLLRLSYTAKKRQMFADVFIFDKCRYVYEQFPSVDCSIFAISELHQQIIFRMVVDGLRKHLRRICSRDVFQFCNVASSATTPGEVDFPNSEHKIPERQMVEFILFEEKGNSSLKAKKYDEAIEFYNKCEVLCPENAVIYAHKAHCYLNLKQPENAVSNCSKALNLDPRNEKALSIRAMAFKIQKDLEKGLTICVDCNAEIL